MPERFWKVGEVAARTASTVRTLHHYEAIGLLCPSGRTAPAFAASRGGHRLYSTADLARLRQIVCLKQLGFPLERIREMLADENFDPREMLDRHLADVRAQAEELRELGDKLELLSARLRREEDSDPETFFQTIEAMNMIERHYTPEQLERLRERGESLGRERTEAVQNEWPILMDRVGAAMAAGVDPASEEAGDCAKRWVEMVDAFTGGDPGIFQSLNAMANAETTETEGAKRGKAMREYVGKAMAARGLKFGGA